MDDKQERYGIKNKFNSDPSMTKYALQSESHTMATNANSTVAITSQMDMTEEVDHAVKYSVLMIALSIIFMNDNEMDSQQFWDHLKRVDINHNEKRHTLLGDVEKYFTIELVKEGYLEYEQVKGIEPITHKFKMGYRAKLETTKMQILEFVCRVYGGVDVCKPHDWNIQYMDAQKGETEDSEDNQMTQTAHA